ncbi:MAG TPA: hypothetical protein VIG06_13935, partial [Kofleriaceae bacterium]
MRVAFALAAILAGPVPPARAEPPPRPPVAAVDGEIFAGYRHLDTSEQKFDAVELERGEAGLGLAWSIARTELRLESLRS